MTVWTEDERAAILDTDELAETVYYYPSYGSADVVEVWAEGFPLSAVFTDSYRAIDMASGQVATTDPTLQFGQHDIQTLMVTDRFQVGSVFYDIINIEPDGAGLVLLRLKK